LKVLFAIRSAQHFPYVESIIENIEKNGHTVELLFDKYWTLRHTDELFKSDRSKDFEWMATRSEWRCSVFAVREFRSFANYCRRDRGSEFYIRRWNSYLPKGIRKISWILRSLIAKIPDRFFQWIEDKVPPDKKIVSEIIKCAPDIVYATPMNMRFSEEVEYVKAARDLGIPSVMVVLSWDNLTTKGTIHVMPDRVLVWNEMQKKEAIEIHGVPEDRIFITGAPFFDKWFENDYYEPREAFCGRFELDPDRSYVVYLGSSRNISGDEKWLAERIVKKGPFDVVIRPHPANKFTVNCTLNFKSSIPETEDEKRDFYNLIYHSLYVTGVNTSAMIDAIIIGKRVFPISSSRYKQTQEDAIHFKPFERAHVIDRDEFIEEYIRPEGICAGWLAAKGVDCD